MTLFLLSIWCLGREIIDAVDSTCQLSLIFHWWFQGIRWLCFRWWFTDQPWHSVFDKSMCRPWLHFFYRFHMSAGTQFSVMISSSIVNQFLLTIYGSVGTWCFWQFPTLVMTLFLLSIWCVSPKFINVIDSTRQLSLSFQGWFLGLQWLSFCWRFMDQQWHSVFDNSLRQPWLYFCYRFDASIVNSLTLWIPLVSCHSIFIDDFKVYSDAVFAADHGSAVT
jgi:hypothetical protein